MAWKVLTVDDVIARATTMEIDANDAAGIKDTSPLEMNLENAVAQVRNAIAQGRKTRVSSVEGSVPKSCVNMTLSIAVFDYASRVLSQPIVVQDARYRQYEQAMEDLQKLRDGDIIPEDENDEVSDASASVSVASWRRQRFSR